MSTEQWRQRVERFRKTDPAVATIVILALILLLAHEGFAITTGRVPFAGPSGDGPYGRILLGLIATVTAFWVRQDRKDTLINTSITAEVRDRVTNIQAAPQSHEGDVEKLLSAMKAERLAAEAVIEANHARERHKLEGRVGIAEMDARDQREQALKYEMQVRDLQEKLANCVGKGSGDKPC